MVITIRDVAEKLGISTAHVSRALNNTGRVSEKTREKVLRTAEEMGYYPNATARSLVTKKTNNIGFTISEESAVPAIFGNKFSLGVFEGAVSEITDKNYNLVFSTLRQDSKDEVRKYPSMLAERIVSGIILAGRIDSKYVLSLKERFDIPIVRVNPIDDINCTDVVMMDSKSGVYKGVKYLAELGHTKIAFLGDALSMLIPTEGLEGFKLALKESGLEYREDLVQINDIFPKPKAGYLAMKNILEGSTRPTAVSVIWTRMALGVLEACKEKGLRVPEDMSVISMYNIEDAQTAIPPLTTIGVDKQGLGRKAVQLLLDRIERPNKEIEKIVFPMALNIRSSTGKINR